QEQAGAGAGESAGDAGGLQLLRGDRSVSDQLRNSAGEIEAGHLSQYQREHGAGDGVRSGGAEGGATAVSGIVSDHAGFRYFARTFGLQEFRRDHFSGRG